MHHPQHLDEILGSFPKLTTDTSLDGTSCKTLQDFEHIAQQAFGPTASLLTTSIATDLAGKDCWCLTNTDWCCVSPEQASKDSRTKLLSKAKVVKPNADELYLEITDDAGEAYTVLAQIDEGAATLGSSSIPVITFVKLQ